MNQQLNRLISDFPAEEVLAATVLVERALLYVAENLILAKRKLTAPLENFAGYEQLRNYEARRRFLLENNLVDKGELREAALNLLWGSRP